VAAACLVAVARPADARVVDGGWWDPAGVARVVARLGRGVGDGTEATGATDRGASEGAATRAGAMAAASRWPLGTTASVIATPAAVRMPPATTAPERKLTSSMRA